MRRIRIRNRLQYWRPVVAENSRWRALFENMDLLPRSSGVGRWCLGWLAGASGRTVLDAPDTKFDGGFWRFGRHAGDCYGKLIGIVKRPECVAAALGGCSFHQLRRGTAVERHDCGGVLPAAIEMMGGGQFG